MICPNCHEQIVKAVNQTEGQNGVEVGDSLFKGLTIIKSTGELHLKCPHCKHMVNATPALLLVKKARNAN